MNIDCPICGEENELNDGDESLVCEDCGEILLVDVADDGKVAVTAA